MGKPKDEARASWVEKESAGEKRARARTIFTRLNKLYPDVKTALDHASAFELLIATVLSAQSTDKMINVITKSLFVKYRTPQDYLKSKPGELEQDIHRSGFFNQKAKSIRGLCATLIEEFDGNVPQTIEELTRLPGVARKTANVVLSNAFGINFGIAVDTHVHRLSWRLGLSDQDDVVKVERELMALTPKTRWPKVSHLLIYHGRSVCDARAPKCDDCVLSDICPASRLPERAPKKGSGRSTKK